MISNISSVIAGIVSAISALFNFSNYGTGESNTLGAGAVAVAVLFAVPILIGVLKKTTSLIKSMRG